MSTKQECPHQLKHLQASCGCCIDCPSKTMLFLSGPTEEHLAIHREAEAGIIHPWNDAIRLIPVPKLVFREDIANTLKQGVEEE